MKSCSRLPPPKTPAYNVILWLTDLLINCSRPDLRSSMNDSSKRPSSLRKGNCLFRALPGRGGTTIWRRQGSTQRTEKKKEKRRRKKSTLNMKQSQHRRHFHCQIWALITISCRIAVQAHVNILITIFLFQKIIIIRLLILYGQVTQFNLCTYIVNYYSLTLLSLSSSFFNHSKSLYLLLTQESFNLKMGRFVYKEKAKNKTCWLIWNSIICMRWQLICKERTCTTIPTIISFLPLFH